MKLIEKALNNNKILLSVFIIITFLIYLPGIDGRFTSDFYNWVNIYDTQDISNLITCFDYPGLHQMYHIPFYLCFKIFFLNEWGWHFTFTTLHALNAVLLYKLGKQLFIIFNIDIKWAFASSLLFLISPFNTETVAWGATIHYLFLLFFTQLSLIYLLDYFKTKQSKKLITFYIFYVLSLFTMELPLVSPGIFIGLALFLRIHFKLNLKQIAIHLLLPLICIIIGYFILSKLVFGAFIGHYGAEKHLTFDLNLISDTLYAYLLKFSTFYRYIPFDSVKNIFIKVYTNAIFQALTFTILIAYTFITTIIKPQIKPSKAATVALLIIFFCISLLPVLNIEMSSNWTLQTDRYSYFGSIFIYLGIAIVISTINKKIRLPILISVMILNISLLIKDVQIWKETGAIANEMIESYQFENEETYTLNLPDNHKGAYLFRNGFAPALRLNKGIDISKNFNHLVSVNTLTDSDSITYSVMNKNKIKVEAVKWGRWFWRNGKGLTAFVDDDFSIKPGPYNASYTIEIKRRQKPNLIYLVGGKWKKVVY